MFRSLKIIINNLLDFIYPPVCFICDDHTDEINNFCSKCWKTIHDEIQILNQKNRNDFPQLKEEMFLDRVVTFWDYSNELEKLVCQLKYQRCIRLGILLGKIIGTEGQSIFDEIECDMIIPVPLHRTRYRERGYNQSEVLCRGLIQFVSVPFYNNLLIRHRNTITQTKLSAQQRQENVRNAFSVCRSEILHNKNVLLVDDIITTGATMNSCAKILKIAGVKDVTGLTLARPRL
jgi:ComF family protein